MGLFDSSSDLALRDLYGEIPPYGRRRSRVPNPLTALTDDEYARYLEAEKPSLFSNIITSLFENLDKFGRPIRALLGKLTGNDKSSWRELAAFIPFSDFSGLTNASENTTPADLRRGIGIGDVDEDAPWYRKAIQGITDLGIDALTNPLTLTGFGAGGVAAKNVAKGGGKLLGGSRAYGMNTSRGALTPEAFLLGQHGALPMSAAERLSGLRALPKNIEEAALESIKKTGTAEDLTGFQNILSRLKANETVPLQGVMRLPFSSGPIGAEPGLARFLAQAATFPFGGIPFSGGRVMDLVTEKLRYLPLVANLRNAFSGTAGVTGGTDATTLPILQQVKEYLHGPLQRQFGQEAASPFYRGVNRLIGEKVDFIAPDVHRYISEIAEELPGTVPTGLSGTRQTVTNDVIANWRALNDKLKVEGEMRGLTIPTTGPVPHSPRFAIGPKSRQTPGDILTSLTASADESIGRDLPEFYRSTLDDMARARGELVGGTPDDLLARFGQGAIGPRGITPEQAPKAFREVMSMQPGQEKYGLYGNYVQNMQDYVTQSAARNAKAEIVHRTLALYAQPYGPGMIQLEGALERMGYATAQGKAWLAKTMDAFGTPLQPGVALGVPEDVIRALEASSAIGEKTLFPKLFDMANNLFKTYVTQPFLAYHVTNIAGGISQNFLTGTYDPTASGWFRKLIQPYVDSTAALKRRPVNGMGQFAERLGLPIGIDDATATNRFTEEMMARNVLSPQAFLSAEVTGPMGRSAAQVPTMPGMPGFFQGTQPGSWNPLATRGSWSVETKGAHWWDRVGMAGHSEFLPVKKAEAVSSMADSWNRMAHAIAKFKQGLTLDAAAASTLAAHFDFRTALSPFEKQWIRSFVPFYNWGKSNALLMAHTFAAKPGVMNVLQGATDLSSDMGYTPPHLRGTLNIPLGQTEFTHPESGREELRQTYMQPLPQLPHEEALNLLRMQAGQSLTEKLGEKLTPLLRMPLELLRGRTFFGDRALRSRELMPEMSPTLRNVLGYLPTARLQSSVLSADRASQMGQDPAQIISTLLGGPKFRTIDLIGARSREAADVLRERLPGILDQYGNVPRERIPELAPEDILRVRARETQQNLRGEARMQRQIERLAEPRTWLQDLLELTSPVSAESRARFEEYLPAWRLELQRNQMNRESLNRGVRNPYSAIMGRQRNEILRRLAGGM